MTAKQNIVWLASYPKSGNTWLRVFLSNILSAREDPVDINNMPESKIASDRGMIDDICGVNSADLTPEEVDLLRPLVYRELSNTTKETLFLKVHDAWTMNTEESPLFPSSLTKAVVYIMRNPLDVAVSFAKHNGIAKMESLKRLDNPKMSLSGNPEKITNQCRQRLLTWSDHVKSWMDWSKLPVYLVTYEDMLRQPEDCFSGVLDFLNIPYSPEDLQRSISNSSFDKLKKQEEEKGFFEKPIESGTFFDSGRSGNWKAHFKQSDILDFCKKNQDILERFGYMGVIKEAE